MIVLDTHIWLWWVNDDTAVLKAEWREMIDNAAEVGISAIVVLRLLGWIGMAVLPCLNQEAFGLKKRCSVQALAWCLFLRKLLRQRSICRNITAIPSRSDYYRDNTCSGMSAYFC